MASDWTTQFAGLSRLEPTGTKLLLGHSRIVKLPANTRIFGPGQSPESYLLLLAGTVRVQQVSATGRELVLYRVQAGESCALTTACLMSYEDYQAEGIAETDIEAVAIPRATFDELIAASAEFRRFVFTTFSQRVTNLLRIIDEVAFARMDIRVAQKLLELADGQGHIAATHQQLAAELGTAREVVSRQLHEFQRRGLIATARGAIQVTQPQGLRELAQNS